MNGLVRLKDVESWNQAYRKDEAICEAARGGLNVVNERFFLSHSILPVVIINGW